MESDLISRNKFFIFIAVHFRKKKNRRIRDFLLLDGQLKEIYSLFTQILYLYINLIIFIRIYKKCIFEPLISIIIKWKKKKSASLTPTTFKETLSFIVPNFKLRIFGAPTELNNRYLHSKSPNHSGPHLKYGSSYRSLHAGLTFVSDESERELITVFV